MAEKTDTEHDNPDKLTDVTPPGKTPAIATSRPIIIGHGSMVKNDPMVVTEDAVTAAEEEKEPVHSTQSRIEVPADMVAAMENEAAEATTAEKSGTSGESTSDSGSDKEALPNKKTDTDASSDSGVVDTLMGEVSAKQADRQQKDELAARTAEVEESIIAKEFFVPIKSENRRRSRRLVGVSLVCALLLVVAGVNMAADAEVLDIGVKPLTNLL